MPKSEGWFRPGVSGNPGGRPKGHGDVNVHARQYAARAIFSLASQCIRHGVPPRDQRAAAKLLIRIRIGFGASTNIGDAILRELGWQRVRQALELEAQRDQLERGNVARRELGIVPLIGKIGG